MTIKTYKYKVYHIKRFMKRFKIILIALLVVALVAVVSGCTNGSAKSDVKAQPTVAPTQAPTKAPTPNPTATPTPEGFSRSSAADIGDTVSFSYSSLNDEWELDMKVVEVIRGTDAWQKIKEANMFNSQPEDGKEYILAKIYVKVTYGSSEDIPTSFNSMGNMVAVSSKGTPYSWSSVVEPEPALPLEVYPGGEAEGYMAYLVDVDDDKPLLKYGYGSPNIWFKLY